ncbi:MAG: hypothetical protein NTV93_19735 [Verrucomicrobia bacterium]|nr:hypothetical protein [Verrucomicrobiota bacterium]
MKIALPSGTNVLIRKLSACRSPVTEPASWADWVHGSSNNHGSLPVSYELRGILLAPVNVGGHIHVFRTWRNGVEADGVFQSTTIVRILGGMIVETFNSFYLVSRFSIPKYYNYKEQE